MKLSSIQAVFLDRDGTIGGTDHVILPGDFRLFPFVPDSIDSLKASGTRIYSFTNQPMIADGEAMSEDFESELLSFGFDKVYLCPHKHGEGCHCRKPSSGMLVKAAEENALELKRCVVVGDRWTDMVAAQAVGCIKVLVKTGSGQRDLEQYRNNKYFGDWLEAYPDFIAKDVNDAVKWILENNFEE